MHYAMTRRAILQKMAENSAYGASQFLLDNILATSGSCAYRHSFLIADLEQGILRIITQRKMEPAGEGLLSALAEDLSSLSRSLELELPRAPAQEVLRIRSHQLAIAKILVFTYAKSDFKLAAAHFHQGRAYLLCGAHEQAVNHLTIASTKVSKISDIKESKLYNSFILTALGQCYYQMQRYDYALEVLLRAHDIQSAGQSQKHSFTAKLTLELLARSYLRQRREKEEQRLRHQEEAVRLIDRLIEALRDQFAEFEGALARAQHLAEALRRSESEECRQTERQGRKKGEQGELAKLLQLVEERLELLVVDFDRSSMRAALQLARGETSRSEGLEGLCISLRELLEELSESLKKQRIFKFKILLSCALVTNATDQELKQFMKEYEQEGGLKRLRREERMEIYKLLLSYAIRFSDSENQLLYLKKLEEMHLEEGESAQNLTQLLSLRKSLARLYAQMHMESESAEVLQEIKTLQQKLFGPCSKPVRKTQSMLKLVRKENDCPDAAGKLRLRKTVLVSTHAQPLQLLA